MAIINFPLPIRQIIREMTKMRKDGDIISQGLSYGCIGCFAFIWIFWLVYRLSLWTTFQILSWISISLTVICLSGVFVYRPIFLSSETRKKKGLERVRRKKYKAIDKLKGLDFEKAIENLTPEEREGYMEDSNREISTKVMLEWVKRDRKLK
jgi:hypothetical protein